jgi:hypothetical protein
VREILFPEKQNQVCQQHDCGRGDGPFSHRPDFDCQPAEQDPQDRRQQSDEGEPLNHASPWQSAVT